VLFPKIILYLFEDDIDINKNICALNYMIKLGIKCWISMNYILYTLRVKSPNISFKYYQHIFSRYSNI